MGVKSKTLYHYKSNIEKRGCVTIWTEARLRGYLRPVREAVPSFLREDVGPRVGAGSSGLAYRYELYISKDRRSLVRTVVR